MGFLDMLGKKKDSSSTPVPPPAAGAPTGKQPAPPLPGQQNTGGVPKPPTPGAPTSEKTASAGPDGLEPPKPQKTQDPKAVFNAIHNDNPPPDFKPDETNLPKFDLPNFPKGYPELDFDIPTFGKKPKQEKAPVQAEAQQDPLKQVGNAPSKQSATEQSTTSNKKTDESMNDETDDKFSTAIPAITPVDDKGNFGSNADKPETTFKATNTEDSKPSFAPATQTAETKDSERKHYEVEHEPFSPKKNFLSKEEEELIDEKEKIHTPRNENGTDKKRIGNVESTLQKKTKVPAEPVFVEVNDYKRALNGVEEIKRDITDSEEMVQKLEEFNDKKHKEFEHWKRTFQYIQAKLQQIDKVMFEPEEKKAK